MPESLYIHIPFCNSICTYCDFAKVYYDLFSRKRYLSVLIEEIKSAYELFSKIEKNGMSFLHGFKVIGHFAFEKEIAVKI